MSETGCPNGSIAQSQGTQHPLAAMARLVVFGHHTEWINNQLNMILVADSGSTNTDWVGILRTGEQVSLASEGYNPFVQTEAYITDSIARAMQGNIDISAVDRVYFYGAGCQGDKIDRMARLLGGIFSHAEQVHVAVDLLAAARSLLGNQAGFAAILGTGTNTCLYDGRKITHHVDSLGYLLGDEGSGSAIGRQVLVDFLRNRMPEMVRRHFVDTYRVHAESLLEEVYAVSQPNRYLASYAKFAGMDTVYAEYGKAVAARAFHSFFERLVAAYPGYRQHQFNCVGSVAYHFRGVLAEVASDYGMELGQITPYVVDGLVAYHAAIADGD